MSVDYKLELRTWPECLSCLVIDQQTAAVLADYHWPESAFEKDNFIGPLFEVQATVQDKGNQALQKLYLDSDYLHTYYNTEQEINLIIDYSHQQNIENLLKRFRLSLDDVNLSQTRECFQFLKEMPLEILFQLLTDWHDFVERRNPNKPSIDDPESWIHRSYPDKSNLYHYLSGSENIADAYHLFEQLVDQQRDYSFGMLLRWVYFHRSEFKERKIKEMSAWRELGV
jgi:hypothetical protein